MNMKWSLYMSSNKQNLTTGSIILKSDYWVVKISLTTGLGSYPVPQRTFLTLSGRNTGSLSVQNTLPMITSHAAGQLHIMFAPTIYHRRGAPTHLSCSFMDRDRHFDARAAPSSCC